MSDYLMLDGWAGRRLILVEIIGETPKRYRVKLLEAANLPTVGLQEAGYVRLVPKTAVCSSPKVIDKREPQQVGILLQLEDGSNAHALVAPDVDPKTIEALTGLANAAGPCTAFRMANCRLAGGRGPVVSAT